MLMNDFEIALLPILFDTAVPRIVLKADAPNFTIVHYNTAYQAATQNQDKDLKGLFLWQAFTAGMAGGDGARLLMDALHTAVSTTQEVTMPRYQANSTADAGNAPDNNWWQLHITPLKGTDGLPLYLLISTQNITEKVAGEQGLHDIKQREQQLHHEIGAINEELASSNEELMATNEELIRSRQSLVILNEQLERRVTERTKALYDSELLFRTLTQETDVLITIGDETGAAVFFNLAWTYVTGRSMAHLLEVGWADLIHPLDRERYLFIYHESLKQKVTYKIEFRLIDKSGHERWMLAKAPARFDEAGNFLGYLTSCIDITERKLEQLELQSINEELAASIEELRTANEELAETQYELRVKNTDLATSEAQVRFMLNAIPQQVWTANPEGGLVYVNQVVCADFGYTTDEIVGHGWQKFIHPEDLPVCLERWIASLSSGKEYVVEFRLLFADGNYKWHLARALPFIEDGEVKLWLGTNTNIDFQKENEKRKDEFLSIASHELKTPVTSLKASLQLLDRMKNDPSPAVLNKLIDQSNRSIQKITTLIDELLNSSRLNEGQLRLSKTTFTIAQMLNQCCNDVRLDGTRQLILEGDETLQITADENRIDQVVVNLVNNAVKYAPASKKIYLTVEKTDGFARVGVRDTGPGIPPDKIPHLFSRYYRADYSGNQYSGLGLGLYICAEIIHKHNGEIGVESKLGEGSTFWFTLPI
jgi:PAS domain S-box-containing protein